MSHINIDNLSALAAYESGTLKEDRGYANNAHEHLFALSGDGKLSAATIAQLPSNKQSHLSDSHNNMQS
jgi:hypothetical protein